MGRIPDFVRNDNPKFSGESEYPEESFFHIHGHIHAVFFVDFFLGFSKHGHRFFLFLQKEKNLQKKITSKFFTKKNFYKKNFLHGPHFLKKNKKNLFLKNKFHASSPQLASAQVGCKSRLRRCGPHIGWPVV
jgi:hypothetical protein